MGKYITMLAEVTNVMRVISADKRTVLLHKEWFIHF